MYKSVRPELLGQVIEIVCWHRQRRQCQHTQTGLLSSTRRRSSRQHRVQAQARHPETSLLQRMATPPLASPTTPTLVRAACTPEFFGQQLWRMQHCGLRKGEQVCAFVYMHLKAYCSLCQFRKGFKVKMPGLLLQGITMTLGLVTTTMPTAASTLTAPRSSGWRWILPQDSSQSLSQDWPRAQLLRAQSVSMQSSAL